MDALPPADVVSPMDQTPADMNATADLSSTDTTGPGDDGGALALLCTSSGGQVEMSMCCVSATAFPATCAVGACGCGPSGHLIATCSCPTSRCFDPLQGCIVRGAP